MRPDLERLRSALVVAGLLALGVAGVSATPGRPGKPAPKAADMSTALQPVEVTPQVDLPQPIFEAENAMALGERLARWDKLITEAGFDAYIGKPINLKEFLATVRKWVGEKT